MARKASKTTESAPVDDVQPKSSVLQQLVAAEGATNAVLGQRAADELAAALGFRGVHGATVTLPSGGIHVEVNRLADPDLVEIH